ncbi:hypothetical protein AAFC00_001190 [Neodothiora populina]|uniref:JmjC domain-containing histone demethylation protein 1 n=1 Tax=Neodothiora populina TaxID=2781224 RepID=A0ABR3PN54_9PEZI
MPPLTPPPPSQASSTSSQFIPSSTFKRPALHLSARFRPSSPVAPSFEPLSPPPLAGRSLDYTTAVPSQQSPQHGSLPLAQTDGPADVRPPPSSNAPRGRKHQRTPSTIQDLADAALLTNKPQSSPEPQPRPQPQVRKSSSVSYHVQHSPPRYAVQPACYSPHAYREPAVKRARSEVGPSPHAYAFTARPSTSHMPPNGVACAHNVEQNIDRAVRRQSVNAIPSEDAELLLNFASRVQPRPVKMPSPVRESSARPPPSLAPSVPSPPTLPALPAPVTTTSATELVQGPSQHDPSASLPSPQDTNANEEEQGNASDKVVVQVPVQSDSRRPSPEDVMVLDRGQEPSLPLAPQQTRTPPEEDLQAPDADASSLLVPLPDTTPQDVAAAAARQPSQVESLSADTAGETDSPKSRPRRGWPKGKPRGPRNKASSTTKPRSSVRRSRASAKTNGENGSTSSGDDVPYSNRMRRKSETDLATSTAFDAFTSAHPVHRQSSVPPHFKYEKIPVRPRSGAGRRASKKVAEDIICSGCAQTRESSHGELDQWIGCNGCKGWFHYDCAGFKNERDVRDVDKFFCEPCEAQHGATTYVRKSSRTHTNVDYAGLNQGILKTSDEDPEHHYIQPIKDGTFTFDPETFLRVRPELVTAEYFETCASFNEPILIPAEWNPKRKADLRPSADVDMPDADEAVVDAATFQSAEEEDVMTKEMEYETIFDDGQDKLGMVIPQGLTVRHVANIIGPDEPLDVIDVKTQGTHGRWNIARFADYYESEGDKPVRNVISLEVSHTKLGKLLQRPKLVRQLDLQDSVWPAEESAKGNYPKVQYYCLMSVADSFTDFHIDFGGSSVYYHILRGRKTFFFIPPKPSHLKAYEDWNNSPEQNFTWLPTKTKECYRVDLYEGDTMLIPSGWIHAVWTPTNSLVIGGNFLTRLHYSTQFKVVDIEKANKTPMKFRYPQFQRVMWYTVIKYLDADPLPAAVAQAFNDGSQYPREHPIWQDFSDDVSAPSGVPNTPEYNARYYSQAELDGLPELVNFIFRTVMISLGRIEGVSEDTRKKVVRSIPKGHGDPLDVARAFALWVAWKRGDEDPPAWAHPEADLPDKESAEPKKLSARALKQLQRQEAINAYRIAGPDRQSSRIQAPKGSVSVSATSPAPSAPSVQHQVVEGPVSLAQFTSTPKTSVLGPKRVACDACRKRRIRCKHKEHVTQTTPASMPSMPSMPSLTSTSNPFDGMVLGQQSFQQTPEQHQFIGYMDDTPPAVAKVEPMQSLGGVAPQAPMTAPDAAGPALVPGNALLADPNSKRGRSKACFDCRKSKRRCVHDENGKLDPVKAEQIPVPRGSGGKKRKASTNGGSPSGRKSSQPLAFANNSASSSHVAPTMPYPMGNGYQSGTPSQQFQQPSPYPEQSVQPQWQHSTYVYPDPINGDPVGSSNGPYHQTQDSHIPYNQQSLEQLANDVLDSRYVNNDEDGGYTVPQHSGAVQPSAYPMQQAVQSHHTVQTHHSSDSGVVLPEGQPTMGGPVQDVRPATEATKSKPLTEHTDGIAPEVPYPIEVNGTGVSKTSPQKSDVQPNTLAIQQPIVGTASQSVQSVPETSRKSEAPEANEAVKSPDTTHSVTHSNDTTSDQSSVKPAATIVSPQLARPGLSNIPLYEPPSSLKERRLSKASQPLEDIMALIEGPEPLQRDNRPRSASKTPAPMGPPKSQGSPSSVRKRKVDHIFASPTGTKKAKFEEEDEESVRLAKELQGQDWGLRRRSREAI